jgi:RNA polymerase sigma-70 factor (ECF subfamily)
MSSPAVPELAPAPDDEALMLDLMRGDGTALDQLMHRWQRPLRAFLHRHLQNEADACDLAQETFVRLYQHRARYRPGARFSTWMFQIALNLARDHARKTLRRRTDSLEVASPAEVAGLASGEASPAAKARLSEEVAAVRSALAELPEELRSVLVLSEYESLPHAEIAEILGTTPKAIESRLHRAREKLRVRLARWLRA